MNRLIRFPQLVACMITSPYKAFQNPASRRGWSPSLATSCALSAVLDLGGHFQFQWELTHQARDLLLPAERVVALATPGEEMSPKVKRRGEVWFIG